MEKVNARRGFIKGFGLLSVVAAGASAPVLANTSTSTAVRSTGDPVLVPPVDEALAPPIDAMTLQITGAYGEKPKPQPAEGLMCNTYYFNGLNQQTTHSVSMTVGMDNRLWIKVDGKWRRVALEA